MGLITAWSFSRYNTYQQCPFKLKCSAVLKLKEPETEPMLKGQRVHKAGEDYVKGIAKKLDPAFKLFKPQMLELRKAKAQTELSWGFTKTWEPCGFFDKGVWCRIKTDVLETLPSGVVRVIDYKTGSMYPEHADQLGLYALGAFKMTPTLKSAQCEDWYLDNGQRSFEVFEAKGMKKLQATWEKKVAPMLADERLLPTKNKWCGRCHYRKANGGPCEL